MVGAIIIVIVLLVVIPVSVLVSGGALAGVIGFFVQKDVDDTNEGSELIDLNG
ncbi:MAG: hypothetical protein M9952_01270 [Microthrixaceae bacterium]|nr:hypothetical protein [Microthrixaceae bacterium]MCO5311556.1 hypothetical protein [Microthrixaceae bacterium]HPB44317.1 hypothetical protein [Microthrixaceae bacterium]